MRLVLGFVGGFFGCFAGRQRAVGEFCDNQTFSKLERGLHRIRQARGEVAAHDDAIDHDVDVVFVFLVQRRHVSNFIEDAVDLDALKTLLLEFQQFLLVFALTAANHRRHDVKARAFLDRQNAVDHLAHRLAFDGQAGGRRIGYADAREQQPHVVVDFGDGSDRRARVLGSRLLLDGNGG